MSTRRRLLPAPAAIAVMAAGLALGACGQPTSAPAPGAASEVGATTQEGSSVPAGPAGTDAPTATLGPTASPTASPSVALPTVATTKVGDLTLTASMARVLPGAGDVRGTRQRPGLQVEYTLVNGGARSLIAYDLVPAQLGSGTLGDVDPEHAWVYAAAGVVRLSKQAFDPAPNVRFAAPPVTGARPLPAGATLTGRAWAPWPPVLDVPGTTFTAPRGPLPTDAASWQFCVQVTGGAEQVGPAPDAVGGREAPSAAPARAPQGDELLCTDPVPLPTP